MLTTCEFIVANLDLMGFLYGSVMVLIKRNKIKLINTFLIVINRDLMDTKTVINL